MLSSSVKTGPEVFASDFQWIPDIIQWNNYTRVWTDSNVPFWRLYLNSLTVAVVGTVVQLIVSSMAGYSFAKIQFKGKNFVFLLMLVTMMIPVSGHNYPTFLFYLKQWVSTTAYGRSILYPAFF